MNSRKYQIWLKLLDSEDNPEIKQEVKSLAQLEEFIDGYERQGFEVSVTYTDSLDPHETYKKWGC